MRVLNRKINSKFFAHLLRLSTFGIAGATTALIYFFLFWVSNIAIGLGYLKAVSIAYFFATLFHFTVNRNITFDATAGPYRHQLLRYLLMGLFNYFIMIFVVSFGVEKLNFSPYSTSCVSVVFTVFTSYLLSRYWVFKV